MFWNEHRVKRLVELIDTDMPYTEIGKTLGCTRQAVSGAVRRHIQKIPDTRNSKERVRAWRRSRGVPERGDDRWNEARLTEPYAQRKLRLQEARS